MFGSVTVNFKTWEGGRGNLLERLMTNMGMFSSVTLVEEANGTFLGSGAAILNCLSREAYTEDHDLPSIVILAAGEGSRLWGVSASCAFIKGLLNVGGQTLIEISAAQGCQLLDLLPSPRSQYVYITGSDNVCEIHMSCRSTPPTACGYYFSLPFKVTDETGAYRGDVLSKLTQLGIMLTNSANEPVFFREKPTRSQIIQDLRRFDTDTVFVNAFCFAFQKAACSALLNLLPRDIWSKPLDWSGHVLTPLALRHGGTLTVDDWMAETWFSKKQQATFTAAQWRLLWDSAGAFLEQHGAPQVISLETSRWFDVGLCSDLVALYSSRDQQVVDCSLGSGVLLPRNTVAIGCTLHSVTGEPGALLYNLVQSEDSPPLVVKANTVYFSFKDHQGAVHSGEFPLDENPKHGDSLSATIQGLGESFRDLQRRNGVSLKHTLFY